MSRDMTDLLNEWSFDPRGECAENIGKGWGGEDSDSGRSRGLSGHFAAQSRWSAATADGPTGRTLRLITTGAAWSNTAVEHGASDAGFALDEAACRELFDEGSRLYQALRLFDPTE